MAPSKVNQDWLELVSRVRSECRESAEELGEKLISLSYRFFRFMGLGREDAEDLAQESVWHIIVKLDKFRDGQFKAWVYAILRHKIADWGRRGRLSCVSLTDADLDLAWEQADEAASSELDAATQSALDEALATLSAKERIILESRLDSTVVPYKDIGTQLGVPEGTVRVQFRRALEKLKVLLERDGRMASWLESHELGAGKNTQSRKNHENTEEQ